jgi:hypothetical protein
MKSARGWRDKEDDMRPLPTLARGLSLLALLAAFTPSTALAAGPLAVCEAGVPFRWPNGGTNIPWNPDQGELGPLSNAQAIGLVAEAFGAWDQIPSSSTTYLQGAPLPVDVTVANFFPYLFPEAPDGLSAIVFDDTGEIFELLFGPGSGVLGFAGPEWMDEETCTILEGTSFLNGASLTGATALAAALDVMVHEFGHYQNLAHTVVNGQVFLGDTTGPTPYDTFPFEALLAVLDNALETMYPFYFGPGFGTASPHKDDVASLSALYPATGFFASTGTIRGRILASNGRTPKTGFNVIARNVANPYLDAVSAISSDYAFDYTPGAPFVGVYTLRGLTPGADYAVYVDGIMEGGFSTPPGVLPGPEEFYNGAAEGNNSLSDPPNQFVALRATAAQIRSGINIIFNRFRPLELLPLLDDSAFELSLPFPFFMCGTFYDDVIVNANGTVSFGAPNPGFAESGPAFLAGPPQIAGAWDDLNPFAGGAVYFTENPFEFTVTFEGVPERTGAFTGTGSNTFSITLKRFLSQIEIRYGGLTMRDGLAGVSCGGAITSGFEQPTDLSEKADDFRISLLFKPAVYERFIPPTTTPPSPGSPNDLSFLTLKFTPTTPYSDAWSEPNDTLRKATRISLPFDSIPVHRFTEIGDDGDVDFYRFTARRGQVIVAEILSSQLDTVLGIYDRRTGEQLAVDDDSGPGPLSKITFTVPRDGEYAVAVSTFPDFDFEGVSTGTGRYVLRVAPAPPADSD